MSLFRISRDNRFTNSRRHLNESEKSKNLETQVSELVDNVHRGRFHNVRERVDRLERKMNIVDNRLDRTDRQLEQFDRRLEMIEEKINLHDIFNDESNKQIALFQTHVDDINTKLENNIDDNKEYKILTDKLNEIETKLQSINGNDKIEEITRTIDKIKNIEDSISYLNEKIILDENQNKIYIESNNNLIKHVKSLEYQLSEFKTIIQNNRLYEPIESNNYKITFR